MRSLSSDCAAQVNRQPTCRVNVGEDRIGFMQRGSMARTAICTLVLQPRGTPRRTLWAHRKSTEPRRAAMTYSLRKTASHLHLAYSSGETSDSLTGRNFVLDVQGHQMVLAIDLTPNFHTRNKAAATYLDALNLSRNHHDLRFLQCSDNLVRARLVRAWDQIDGPLLRMDLDLGLRGCFRYTVRPHSLFMGGIQFDVEQVLGLFAPAAQRSREPATGQLHPMDHA